MYIHIYMCVYYTQRLLTEQNLYKIWDFFFDRKKKLTWNMVSIFSIQFFPIFSVNITKNHLLVGFIWLYLYSSNNLQGVIFYIQQFLNDFGIFCCFVEQTSILYYMLQITVFPDFP